MEKLLTFKESGDGSHFVEFQNRFISGKDIVEVIKYDTLENYNLQNSTSQLKKEDEVRPVYKIYVKNKMKRTTQHGTTKIAKVCAYILHSSENEHIERCLAGTDNPMYDFIHELRYNPRALPTSPILEECKQNFKRCREGDDK